MTRRTEEWLVVLRADGVVDSVEGAPAEWVGQLFADAPGTSGVLRRAAAELISAPPASHVRRRKVRAAIDTEEVEVELLVVEALPLRRGPAPVQELVMRTLELFASQARSNKIDLTIEQADDVPPVVVLDAEKIAWALSTLVSNALRYARTHIKVTVAWHDDARELDLTVSDDGPGIPTAKLPWLFERDPESGQSAGLALAMVRDVMAAHRGSVTAKNLPGHGTAFTLRVPRVQPAKR